MTNPPPTNSARNANTDQPTNRQPLPGFSNQGSPSPKNPHAWLEDDVLILDDGTSAWGDMTDEEIDDCLAQARARGTRGKA